MTEKIKKRLNMEGANHFGGSKFIFNVNEFIKTASPPQFIVEKVIQRGQIYSFTAKWGHGKTALGLTWAVHIAAGQSFAGFKTLRSRVLYLAGENPADIQLRVIAICREFEIDLIDLEGWLYFSDKAFPINHEDICDYFVKEAKSIISGQIDLIFVDTGIAHSEVEEENANGKMHKVAVAMRELAIELYGAGLVIFMHPTQGATVENIRTRGGGAFAGQIDGELLAWQDQSSKQIKFWHSSKFRGGGFEPAYFDLKRVELEGFDDNFGNKAVSVVALPGVKAGNVDSDELGGNNKIVLDAFVRCAQTKTLVTEKEWRRVSYEALKGTKEAKQTAFRRAKSTLLASKMIIDAKTLNSYRLPKPTFGDVGFSEEEL
jgi:hypothetical protein